MNNIRNLHTKVHNWIDAVGFRLNTTQTNKKNKVTTHHYFFETFNFFERNKDGDTNNSKFLCFDTYGEKVNVRSLLDLQAAFLKTLVSLNSFYTRLFLNSPFQG